MEAFGVGTGLDTRGGSEDLYMEPEEMIDSLKAQLKQAEDAWQADVERRESEQTELVFEMEKLKVCLASCEDSRKTEIEVLSKRIKTTDTLLGYLRSKARIMVIPPYAHASCGIRHEDGVGLVDKRGVPMAEWDEDADMQLLEGVVGLLKPECSSAGDAGNGNGSGDVTLGLLDREEEEYVERIATAVVQVTEVMELLIKRAIVAESMLDAEKEKSKVSQDEIKEKCAQIENMWARVEEMERVALGTTGVLKEMQVKLEDMELETSKQRLRAAENEKELSRVRQDFGILRSSVDNLVKARDRIRSMEKRIQDVEKVSESLTSRVIGLEAGKRQQQAEIGKLLSENDSLRAALDFKEAELSAIGHQVRILCEHPEKSGLFSV